MRPSIPGRFAGMRSSPRTLIAALVFAAAAPAAAAPPLLPFPNDRLTKKDKTTATRRRLHPALPQMPKNKDGRPISPADINRFDGFSPGSAILVKTSRVDTPAELAKLHAVSLGDLARYTAKKAPVTVTDANSHKRWPIWV